MATIGVRYSCDGCGVTDAEVQIPLRRDDEDVREWVTETMAVCISRDHQARSPGWPAREMREVKIPMAGRTMIGGPTSH